MTRRPDRPARTLVLTLVLVSGAAPAVAQTDGDSFPTRVLITNDNGIDDPKIAALARAFAARAEVWVVAPDGDRSGSGTYVVVTRMGALTAEPRDLGPDIRAFAVNGFPADCVLLAFLGLMKDSPPDLVVSGINGGPNLGSDWMFSGTVGAARVAALAGVPAIAVSGVDDDIPGAADAAAAWVARLAGNDLVRDLGPRGYLTVSIPAVPPAEIKGIRVTDRAPLELVPRLEAGDQGMWFVTGTDTLAAAPSGDSDQAAGDSDQAAWDAGYIVLVPMRADEVDQQRLLRWQRGDVGAELEVPKQP